MASLVALIALVTLIIRHHRHGHSWPMAMLTGVKRYLQGLIAIAGLLLLLVVGVGTTRAILHPVAEAMTTLFPQGQPPASWAGRRPELPATEIPAEIPASPPTPTPRVVVASTPQPRVTIPPTSIPEAAVESPTPTPVPTRTSKPATSTPTTTLPATPVSDVRTGCDPAYPDANTCIPPGPPFEQGCAITDERHFTVLPPDPQGLDRDNNGIGCEPVS